MADRSAAAKKIQSNQAEIKPLTQRRARIRSVNPATAEELASFESLSPLEVNKKIGLSSAAFEGYRRTSFEQRAEILRRVAGILESEKERWGELMAHEMGKLHRAGIEEAEKCARGCRYYAQNGERFLANRPMESSMGRSYVAYHPIGPVLAIMPWNFPFWQVFRFAAPALMAGNTGLLKHASNVPQCALAIEEIFRRAGLPEAVFQTLLIGSADVETVINDDRVMAVTLTGSDAAGSKVAQAAGRNLKKTVLELGGSDPFIIMPSVDLDHVVQMAVAARNVNNGESCIAAKRFIVHEAIADEFERRFAEAMGSLRIGDPMEGSSQIGPLATASIRDILARQVEECVRAGAKVLTGGHALPGEGYYYPPTVITQISKNSPAYSQEFFGPVALVFRARNLEEAVALANDNPYGLGSSLWGVEPSEQEYFVREIQSGLAFVNRQVASDPALPFGGVKRSGYGRELSDLGIHEFVNIKTVVVNEERNRAKATGTE